MHAAMMAGHTKTPRTRTWRSRTYTTNVFPLVEGTSSLSTTNLAGHNNFLEFQGGRTSKYRSRYPYQALRSTAQPSFTLSIW